MKKLFLIFQLFCFSAFATTLQEDYEQLKPLSELLAIESGASVNLLMPYAEQGNSVAYFLLGNLYEQGQKVDKDLKKAFEMYSKAADKNPMAEFRKAEMMLFGQGTDQDLEGAVKIYVKLLNDNMFSEVAKERLSQLQYLVEDQTFLLEQEEKALFGDEFAMLVMTHRALKDNNPIAVYVWLSLLIDNASDEVKKQEYQNLLVKVQGEMSLKQITQAEKELFGISQALKKKK